MRRTLYKSFGENDADLEANRDPRRCCSKCNPDLLRIPPLRRELFVEKGANVTGKKKELLNKLLS